MSQSLLLSLPDNPRAARLTSRIPKWLSPAVALELSGHIEADGPAVSFSFSRGEQKALRRRKMIAVSEWAERFRVVEMSSIPGRWKNLFTPYLVGVMDAAGTPGVEVVIVCKSPQTGGSEAGHNLVGWCVDRSPGPVMYVFPDEITARENAKDRIIPMLTGSKRLREYMTGYHDDASSLRVNLAHMPIYLGWSGSVSRLGNKPVRTLILDELDKYKNPKNEASSESLAEKRTTTWRGRKHIFKVSTPTTEDGPIWTAFTQEAGARFDYWVSCPHCLAAQIMRFEGIGWPDKDTDKEPSDEDVLARRLAYYPCERCGAVWDDSDRDRAVRKGEWRERTSGLRLRAHLSLHKPIKVGFHIPAWLSFFVSLSEVAAAALRHKRSGKLNDLKNLQNQYKAEPWKEEHVARSEDVILALCDTRPAGVVPNPETWGEQARPPIAALVAGVDTQMRYFRYVIRAFAYGASEESWLIACGLASGFEDLTQILWKNSYQDSQGKEHPVRAAMIDAMGTRTKAVYAWCVRHRGRAVPYQGARSLSAPIAYSPLEYFPDARGNRVKIPGGLILHRVDTTFFKGDLAEKLAVRPEDPGAFHLHSNKKKWDLAQYAREMCAEVWSAEENAWLNPRGRDNHYWDCEVMALACAYQLGIRHWREPRREASASKTPMPVRTVSGKGRSISDMIAAARS